MYQSVITRASLGRGAKIGALYDVRTESFLLDSLFGSELDEKSVGTMELGDTSVELVLSDSIEDKFRKLDIEAELQISLLSGQVKLSGSGAYLNEEKKSARSQSMSLVYKIITVNEEFMLRHNRGLIDVDIFKGDLLATHVVVGIDWGAACSITCRCENSDGKDETIVKGALSAHLEKLKSYVNVSGSARVDYGDTQTEKVEKFTYKCTSDVSTMDKDLPTSLEGALELAKSLPNIVKKTNNGKGVPMLYMMMPLDIVAKICNLQVSLDLHYASIQEDSVKKTAQVMESITQKRRKLYDIQQDLHALQEYVPETSLSTVDKCMNEILVDESKFKHRLQEMVTKIRRKEADISTLDEFLSKIIDSSSIFMKCDKFIREIQGDINSVNLIKDWLKRGIMYLGKKDYFTKDNADLVYVLFKPTSDRESLQVKQNEEFFLRYQKTYAKKSEAVFQVVDQNIRPELWGNTGSKARIEEYRDGRMTCDDFLEKEGKSSQMCLVKHLETRYSSQWPSERATVKIRCPNTIGSTAECSGSPIIWKCAKCKAPLEYGMKTFKFYCKCGESEPSKSLFRCNESVHGMDYVEYPEEILRHELGSLRAMKEKNILILGETGVGKSTWINGIVNYLSFLNLNEAMQADEFLVLIPSEFTFTKAGESVVIKVGGDSENEFQKAGHSATQKTTSYIFHVGEHKIRLIDTPGIGDSRGIEQDRENFDNILSYVSMYDEIHAVCILLKPNNSRLHAMFRFCIQELLVRLHTSAKENIVFCFTNARGTFYQPGDTLPALNAMLREKKIGITANPNNFFCFDNEPFRFLACLRNNVEFDDEDIKTYSSSWDKAVKATNKLFGHVDKIPPHKVRNTISMNEARRVVVAMSKPMAEVARTIQENNQLANQAKQQIDLHEHGISDLEKSLKFNGWDLEREHLSYPVTVCTHSDCIEVIGVGNNNVHQINYKQICHDHCYLKGIPTETVNDARLAHCRCIKGTTCRYCGHCYQQHMHLTYNMKKVAKEFISDDVKKKITAKTSEKEKKEEFKRQIDIKVAELEEEGKTILQVSAKYGAFLKDNALIPYNDAVGDYLDMVIKQEDEMVVVLRDKDRLDRLRNLRAAYDKEKEILDKAIQLGETTSPDEVMQLQKQLFDLKNFGPTLKKIFDGIAIGKSLQNMQFCEIVAPIRQSSPKDRRQDISDPPRGQKSEGTGWRNWARKKWSKLWKSTDCEEEFDGYI